MLDLDLMHEILADTTTPYQKDPAVTHILGGGVAATVLVDVHFMIIGVDLNKAEKRRMELRALLAAWPSEVPLSAGPSYIHVGGVLGDQGAAFHLFALGQALNFWKVITPKDLGLEGKLADDAAGKGYVMINSYRV